MLVSLSEQFAHGRGQSIGPRAPCESVGAFDTAAFDTIRSRHPKSLVADDDILDAFAALWTAERIYNAEAGSLPELSSLDSKGIPMRMMD